MVARTLPPSDDEGKHVVRALTIAVLAALLTAAVGSAPADAAATGQPGVTRTEIRVGGVTTGGLGGRYASAFDGVQAAFDVINERGGVFGRRLVLARRLDDHGLASENIAANRRLIEDHHVFSVLPESTRIFAGAKYLAVAGTPTFGWNVNTEWSEAANLFGDRGSYSCGTCSAVAPAYVANRLQLTTAAVLAGEEPASPSCGVGLESGLDRFGVAIPVVDTAFTGDPEHLDADVHDMQEAGVQLVATCGIGVDDLARLARALRRDGLDAAQIYASGTYDPAALTRAGKSLDGMIAGIGFVPWEAPARPSGTQAFVGAMKRRGQRPTEAAQAGWVGAGLLVEGIRAAGRRFTQASVVAAINAITDFTSAGILPGVDWSSGGHGPAREACTAFVEARHGAYAPRFGGRGKPFVCFPDNPLPDSLETPVLKPVGGGSAGGSPGPP